MRVQEMKPSANRHPLAKLRKIIDLGQKELAAILDWPLDTYQKIELKTIGLTTKRVLQVQEATGVSAKYLEDGDVEAAVVDCHGEVYTLWFIMAVAYQLSSP